MSSAAHPSRGHAGTTAGTAFSTWTAGGRNEVTQVTGKDLDTIGSSGWTTFATASSMRLESSNPCRLATQSHLYFQEFAEQGLTILLASACQAVRTVPPSMTYSVPVIAPAARRQRTDGPTLPPARARLLRAFWMAGEPTKAAAATRPSPWTQGGDCSCRSAGHSTVCLDRRRAADRDRPASARPCSPRNDR